MKTIHLKEKDLLENDYSNLELGLEKIAAVLITQARRYQTPEGQQRATLIEPAVTFNEAVTSAKDVEEVLRAYGLEPR